MRYQLNSILNQDDGIYQLSALAALRTLLPRFWDQRSRSGPFVLTLADLHQSNFFVDDEWNITRLIDLEFAPVRPVQMAQVPSWLSGRGVDELDGPAFEEYAALYDEFVTILEAEEIASQHDNAYSQTLRESWRTGRFWYTMALDSVNGYPQIFVQHLRSKFFEKFQLDTDGVALAQLWDEKVMDFISAKLEDYQRYVGLIHKIFEEAGARGRSEDASVIKGEGESGNEMPDGDV